MCHIEDGIKYLFIYQFILTGKIHVGIVISCQGANSAVYLGLTMANLLSLSLGRLL